MPKDSAPGKRKAADEPIPLFDNNTRGFLSTRTTTSSNASSRIYASRSRIIAALPKPLFGDYDEAIYTRPLHYLDGHEDSDTTMDAVDDQGLQSGLPGITIKQTVRKRYINSVRLFFFLHKVKSSS